MNWYEPHKPMLEQVYAKAEHIISSFPMPLGDMGLNYLDKYNLLKNELGANYICALLPFWLKDETGVTDEQCQLLALANQFCMLYYFIQDDLMDGTPDADWKGMLALGNMLHLEMQRILRGLFPVDSLLWSCSDRYVTRWADCVMNESPLNYFITNPLNTAGKASPLKIASTGALLLGKQPEKIPLYEEAVDIVLMALQMSDDWFDWKEDLQDGSYNGLLAMLSEENQAAAPLSAEQISAAIYVKGCMQRYIAAAAVHEERLLSILPPSHELYAFYRYILDHLSLIAERIDRNRELLLKGGLHYYYETNKS